MAIYDLSSYNLEDVPELTPAPADTETFVRVVSCEVKVDKNGADYWMPKFELPEYPNAPNFTRYTGLPGPLDDEKKANAKLRGLAAFTKAFGFGPKESIDPEKDLVGREAWVILGIEPAQEGTDYGPRNFIKKYVGPK